MRLRFITRLADIFEMSGINIGDNFHQLAAMISTWALRSRNTSNTFKSATHLKYREEVKSCYEVIAGSGEK